MTADQATAATSEFLRGCRRGGVAVIELNRPARHNALNDAMLTALLRQLHLLAADTSVRVLILTGAGRSFCSGDDLKDAASAGPAEFARTVAALQALSSALIDLDKPVIAALNGPAFGAGLELLLSCDLRIATSDFRCATPEVRLGLIATNGATLLLPQVIGPARARRMLLGGERMDADWCVQAGLIDELTTPEQLLPRAIAIAEEIMQGGPAALAATRSLLNATLRESFQAALEREAQACQAAHDSDEGRDGVSAYLLGTPPRWLAR